MSVFQQSDLGDLKHVGNDQEKRPYAHGGFVVMKLIADKNVKIKKAEKCNGELLQNNKKRGPDPI